MVNGIVGNATAESHPATPARMRRVRRVHMLGIGGSGMAGIAEVLINLGYTVSGTDLKHSAATQRLADLGAQIFLGHDAANTVGAEPVFR